MSASASWRFTRIKVASALYRHIIDFTEKGGYPSLRIAQSACNVESFSLYTHGGAYPRHIYHDMVFPVPADGFRVPAEGKHLPLDRVRPARITDVTEMGRLELDIAGIIREQDYRYCVENKRGFWSVSVMDDPSGGLEGFMISCGHPSFNMLGPCVARSEDAANALILRELDRFRGRTPIFLVPADKQKMVRLMYDLGALNCEMHFYQARGEFTPFKGVVMPTFLPETG